MSSKASLVLPQYEDNGWSSPAEKDPYGSYTFGRIQEYDPSATDPDVHAPRLKPTSSSSVFIANEIEVARVIDHSAHVVADAHRSFAQTSSQFPHRLEPLRRREDSQTSPIHAPYPTSLSSPNRTRLRALRILIRVLLGLAQSLILSLCMTSLGLGTIYGTGGYEGGSDFAPVTTLAVASVTALVVGLILIPATLLCSAALERRRQPSRDGETPSAGEPRVDFWIPWPSDPSGRAVVWLSFLTGVGALPLGMAVSGLPEGLGPRRGFLCNITGAGLLLTGACVVLWPAYETLVTGWGAEKRRR